MFFAASYRVFVFSLDGGNVKIIDWSFYTVKTLYTFTNL